MSSAAITELATSSAFHRHGNKFVLGACAVDFAPAQFALEDGRVIELAQFVDNTRASLQTLQAPLQMDVPAGSTGTTEATVWLMCASKAKIVEWSAKAVSKLHILSVSL